MANLLARIHEEAKKPASRSIETIDDYVSLMQDFLFQGNWYGGGVQQTISGEPAEYIENSFEAYANQIYKTHGPIFALMAVRMSAFSTVRFQWQIISGGRPSKLFGNESLSVLETPWVGGTTQDLLVRMITDADFAGNFYGVRVEDEIVRLRPDWVGIILAPRLINPNRPKEILGFKKVGYIYKEGGFNASYADPVFLLPNEVIHFAPVPDPLATYRGMSWLTPALRDIQNDKLMQTHQRKFFENAATPNMVVSLDSAVDFDEFMRFKAQFNLDHKGLKNAYKTLFMGGGADATVVGANFEQMAFTGVQGRGETRLAAMAGVPVTIVGFSEGLQGSSLNAGNFAQARRRLADLTMHPLWANAAGSLQTVIPRPGSSGIRLWYDSRDVPFLREDAKDQAEIMQIRANVLNALKNSGWTPESALQAVLSDDFSGLQDTGLVSVQLQAPGTTPPLTDNGSGTE